jgi:alpha-tubulin suppressor-like RCC1 family protein
MNMTFTASSKIISIAAGAWHTLVLLENGKLFAFGNNEYGQLCDGSTQISSTPAEVNATIIPSDQKIVQVVAGHYHTIVVTNTGDMYSCGLNNFGQLGYISPTFIHSTLGKVNNVNLPPGVIPKSVQAGQFHSAALLNDILYMWGSGTEGKSGNDSFNNILKAS